MTTSTIGEPDVSPPGDTAVATAEPKASAPKIVGGLALSLLSVALIYVSFPDQGGLYPLLLIAFVPMYVAAYRLMPRRLAAIPMLITAAGYWSIIWLVAWDLLPGTEWAVYGAGLIFGVVCASFFVFDRKFSERTGYRWFVVQVPLWWVGMDILFQDNLWDGTNGWLAYRFAAGTPFIQTVSIVSTPVLTFLVLMLNAVIALLILKWMDKRWPQLALEHVPANAVKWSSVVTFGLVIVWVASSLFIYSSLNAELDGAKSVRVAAIQPSDANMPSGAFSSQDVPNAADEAARKVKQQAQLTRMTKDAVAQGAQMSVWPEETLNYDPRGPQGQWVSDLAKETQSSIVTGFNGETPVAWPNQAAPNMAAVFGPTGDLVGVTYKVHPVLAAGEAWGGTTPQIYPTFSMPFGQLGVMICFDHDFPDGSARLLTLTGSEILANPSWDWGSISSIRWQSLVFRSVENRIPIVKGEAGFDSAITDANGVVLAKSDVSTSEGAEAVLVQDVRLSPRNAPFTELGGMWFGVLVLLGAAGRYIWQITLWRRARHP